jgi:hypothetical protein
MTVEEMALGERKFLHDISNQLVVAQGMSSFLSKALKENDTVGEKEKERMEKVIKSVKSMIEMLKERRAILHSVSRTAN